MGEKKQKEKTVAQWKKVLVIGACVLFVVLMIVSGMGSGWISAFAVAKPGDVVVVDYTFYDAGGNPLLTTDQNIFKQSLTQGKPVLYTRQLTLTANQSLTPSLIPIQVSATGSSWIDTQFAIFKPEYDAMTSGIVGMKVNEQKKISIPSYTDMTKVWTSEDLKPSGVNMSDINNGDILTMGVHDPDKMATNTSSPSYIRIGEISQKTAEGVVVEFGYPVVDIRIVSINNNNN